MHINASAIGFAEITNAPPMTTSNPAIAKPWNAGIPFACSGAKTNIIKTSKAVSNVSSQSLYLRRKY
jgi:hypothetical protein